MTAVRFRDPPPADERARALLQKIGEELLAARRLPAPLPGGSLSLLELHAEGPWLDLIVGPTDPVARVRVRSDRGEVLGLRHPRAARVRAVVEPLDAAAARHEGELEALAARLRTRLAADRWARAEADLAELAALPRGIPLTYLRQLIEGVEPVRGLLRTGFGCNQDCGLCWQGRRWGGYGADQLRVWIEDLARAGVEGLTFSGGEPTMDARLPELIAYAKSLGLCDVVLETNAVLLAKPGRARALVEAGLDTAFVSLHSPDPDVSDRITAAPGTHARTVRGIGELLDAGAGVILNAVVTSESAPTLPALPGFVRGCFGDREPARIVLSYPTRPFDAALLDALVPDPDVLRPALRAVIAGAKRHGVRLEGLDGPCGPPLCAFDADPSFASLSRVVEPVHFRGHVDACARCAVRDACFGVRPETVERFGDRAVAPVS